MDPDPQWVLWVATGENIRLLSTLSEFPSESLLPMDDANPNYLDNCKILDNQSKRGPFQFAAEGANMAFLCNADLSDAAFRIDCHSDTSSAPNACFTSHSEEDDLCWPWESLDLWHKHIYPVVLPTVPTYGFSYHWPNSEVCMKIMH